MSCSVMDFAGKQAFEVPGIYVESSLMGHGSCSNHGHCFGQWRSKLMHTFYSFIELRKLIYFLFFKCVDAQNRRKTFRSSCSGLEGSFGI